MKSLKTLTSAPKLSYSDSNEDIRLLQDAMRHIFQRAMAEPNEEIQNIIFEVTFLNIFTITLLFLFFFFFYLIIFFRFGKI